MNANEFTHSYFYLFICQHCQKCCDQFCFVFCGTGRVTWAVGGDRALCLWAIAPALSAPFSFLGPCLLNWSTLSVISTTESPQFALNYPAAWKEQEVQASKFLYPFNNEIQNRSVTSVSSHCKHNMLKQLKLIHQMKEHTIDVLMNVIVSVLSVCLITELFPDVSLFLFLALFVWRHNELRRPVWHRSYIQHNISGSEVSESSCLLFWDMHEYWLIAFTKHRHS